MVDKVVNAIRLELTPGMKFVIWMVVAIFAVAQLIGQVGDNTKGIKDLDNNLASHQKTDDLRHTQVIERIHGTELMYTQHKQMLMDIDDRTEKTDTKIDKLDDRFTDLEKYLMQYDFDKRK
jgi:hypothetical protein